VLGHTFSFAGTQDGRALLVVDGATVSCAQGETVTVGNLTLECTRVTADSVEFDASLS
jgi:hypothetical protein